MKKWDELDAEKQQQVKQTLKTLGIGLVVAVLLWAVVKVWLHL